MSPPSFCVMSSPYSTRDELSAGMVPNLTTPLRKLAAGHVQICLSDVRQEFSQHFAKWKLEL